MILTTKLDRLQLRLPLDDNGHPPLEETSAGPAIDHTFPVEEANALAGIESFNKHLFRPNSYLHKWWARRSGTTFRYILKQLSDNPTQRDYYTIGGLEGKVILDPMMGGGTTLHEAIRLGASVIGFDIDPIPVLQAQATLMRIPLQEKEAVFNSFHAQLAARLSPYFQTTCPTCAKGCETQFVLYGVRKRCRCGETVLVDSLALREETDGTILRLHPETGEVYAGEPVEDIPLDRHCIREKASRTCPVCNLVFEDLRDIPYVDRYAPLVVVGGCSQHGQFWRKAEAEDIATLQRAKDFFYSHYSLPFDTLGVPIGPKSSDLLNKGIGNFADLFTPRQLLHIATCKELLDTVDEQNRLWLGLLVSTSLEFNALLCGYKGSDKRRPGAIRHVFSHHAYSFPYTALENNPVFNGNTSGTLRRLFNDRVRAGAVWAEAPVERRLQNGAWSQTSLVGEIDGGLPVRTMDELLHQAQSFLVAQQDSSRLPLPDESVNHVVTDPPYYDSVQYSDLATFFRVWLRWLLPNAADWDYDTLMSAVAENGQKGLKYQIVLTSIWSECHRVLQKPNGRLIFTFHHWRPEAWTRLTLSLKNAGFRLVHSFTIYSENPISVHIRQLNALKHDSILVLQPAVDRPDTVKYPLIERISSSDSYTFCSECAKLLGYCLDAPLSEDQISELWKKAMGS